MSILAQNLDGADLIVLSARDTIGEGWLIAHAKTDAGEAALPALIDATPGAVSFEPVWGSSGCPELGPTRGGFCFHADAWGDVIGAVVEHDLRFRAPTERQGRKTVAVA